MKFQAWGGVAWLILALTAYGLFNFMLDVYHWLH
jgi:hypothetical protein